MPISSGAVGRARADDSYLKRYLGTLPKEKRNLMEKSLEACISGAAAESLEETSQGLQKEDHTQGDGRSEVDRTDEPLKTTSSKKSSTCTVL